MREQIRPVLSSDEWRLERAVRVDGAAQWRIQVLDDGTLQIAITAKVDFTASKPTTLTALIALANRALPSDDPRKVTHEIADAIEDLANFDQTTIATALRMPVTDVTVRKLRRFAAGLRSLLPPA